MAGADEDVEVDDAEDAREVVVCLFRCSVDVYAYVYTRVCVCVYVCSSCVGRYLLDMLLCLFTRLS